MSDRSVPRFQHQLREKSSNLEHLAPDPSAIQQHRCIILEVYDLDRMEQLGAPNNIKLLSLRNPGLLFAKVLLLNSGSIRFLPFSESEDVIALNYGNSALIEGRYGIVTFLRNDAEAGQLRIEKTVNKGMLPHSVVSEVYDIIGTL